MNIKKIIAGCLSASLLLGMSAYAKTQEFTIGSDKYYVRDTSIESKQLDSPAYIENGRTMVPVRAVAESFDAEVEWIADARKAVITAGSTVIELIADSDTAYVNGTAQALDSAAVIRNDRVMVPLRFVSETLNKSVEYVPASQQILIYDTLPVCTVNGTPITADDYLGWFVLNGYTVDSPYLYSYLSDTTNTLTNMALIAQKAYDEGYSLTQEQCDAIINTIGNDKELIYSSSLFAPVVKILSEDLISYAYMKDRNMIPTAEEVSDYYDTNYVCAKHILLVFPENEDGSEVTEEQKAQVKKDIEAIKAKIDAGEDFDTLMNEYCEDPGIASNPDGYVFTYGEMVEPFEKASFDLEVGAVSSVVETSYGYHIIKREPLPQLTTDFSEYIQANLTQERYTPFLMELVTNVDYKTGMSEEELLANISGGSIE